VQVLIDKVGLNTGQRTQQLQTARVITSRLSGWLLKKEKSWARLLRFLPEHARKRHQQCGLPLQHAVLQEVVAWYKEDKTRMQDYNMFDEEKVMSLATTKWTPPRVSR
jgi:hypothetical protein